jgi:hypothetical protein
MKSLKLCSLLSMLALLLLVNQVFGQDILEPVNSPVYEVHLEADVNGLDLNSEGVSVIATTNGLYFLDDALNQLLHHDVGEDIRSAVWRDDSSQLAVAVKDKIEIWNWDSGQQDLQLEITLTVSGIVRNLSQIHSAPA